MDVEGVDIKNAGGVGDPEAIDEFVSMRFKVRVFVWAEAAVLPAEYLVLQPKNILGFLPT